MAPCDARERIKWEIYLTRYNVTCHLRFFSNGARCEQSKYLHFESKIEKFENWINEMNLAEWEILVRECVRSHQNDIISVSVYSHADCPTIDTLTTRIVAYLNQDVPIENNALGNKFHLNWPFRWSHRAIGYVHVPRNGSVPNSRETVRLVNPTGTRSGMLDELWCSLSSHSSRLTFADTFRFSSSRTSSHRDSDGSSEREKKDTKSERELCVLSQTYWNGWEFRSAWRDFSMYALCSMSQYS